MNEKIVNEEKNIDPYKISVFDVGFPNKILTRLADKGNIYNLGLLSHCSRSFLVGPRGYGEKSFQCILDKLEEYGVPYKGELNYFNAVNLRLIFDDIRKARIDFLYSDYYFKLVKLGFKTIGDLSNMTSSQLINDYGFSIDDVDVLSRDLKRVGLSLVIDSVEERLAIFEEISSLLVERKYLNDEIIKIDNRINELNSKVKRLK